MSFHEFLFNLSNGKKKCLLVAHNARFDAPRLLRAVINVNLPVVLAVILGFTDTSALFRKKLTDRKGPGQFKLETLSKDFLGPFGDQQAFHDAAYDVTVLQSLTKTLKLENNLCSYSKDCYFYLDKMSKSDKIKTNLRSLTELSKQV